jgi:outer membrane lipoprotein LolB
MLTNPKISCEYYLSRKIRQDQLASCHNWSFQSAVIITNAQEKVLVHIRWQQFDYKYILNITSLFNFGGVKIIGDPTNIALWRSATNKTIATTPEELMDKELGWSLPLKNMRYWIVGLPAPKLAYTFQVDRCNRLIFLQQQGWKISYADFVSVNKIDFPTTILLNNAKLQIKVMIRKWSIG